MYVSKRAQALLPHLHDNLVYTLCLAAFLVFVLVLTSQNLCTVTMSSSVDEASKSLHDDVQVEPPPSITIDAAQDCGDYHWRQTSTNQSIPLRSWHRIRRLLRI